MIKKHFNKILIVIATCLMLVAGIFISTDRIKTVNADNNFISPYNIVYLNNWTSHNQNDIFFTYSNRMWTDGTNIYYSSDDIQYVLDTSSLTWTEKTWTGLTSFDGRHVWTDGVNIYYSYFGSNYVLDISSSTWSEKTWTGLTSFDGRYIWTDGTNIYCSNGVSQFVLDISNSIWSEKTWTGLTSFDGYSIWSDGINIYYSMGASQFVLDTSNSTWSAIIWTGLSDFDGRYIWTDGTNIYYSSTTNHYVLDISSSTWSEKTWTGLTSFSGFSIFDKLPGVIICYAYNSSASGLWYTLDSQQATPPTPTPTPLTYNQTWSFYTATGPNSFEQINGDFLWTDGTNIYYSAFSSQYVLDLTNSIWSNKTWNGLSSFGGDNVWTDGTNIYYSSATNHYVLDISTSTWSEKTWNVLTNFYGRYIWTDGTNIYYSSNYNLNYEHYVLDIATSTWIEKTWTGLTEFTGLGVWVADNVYYTYFNGSFYSLDIATSTWSLVNITSNISNFNNACVWNDGTNTYYSNGSNNYIFDNVNLSWLSTTFVNLTNFYGYYLLSYPSEFIIYLDSSDFSYYLLNTGSNSGGGNATSTNYTFNGSNYITFGYSNISSLNNNFAYIFNSYFDIVDNTNIFTITMTSRAIKYTVTNQGYLQQTTTNPSDSVYSQSLTLNIGTSYTDYVSSTAFRRYFKVSTSGWSNSNVVACSISSELNVDSNDNTQYYILYHFNYINSSNEILYITIVVHTSRSLLDEYSYLINDYVLLSSRTIYFTQNTGDGSFADGYNTGYIDGQQIGYSNGFSAGSSSGYNDGYNAGLTVGNTDGYNRGYNAGFNAGVVSANDYSFLSLIGAVVDAPFTYFSSLTNFDILGFNVFNFITGLLTLAFVLIIIKLLLGGK